jgi:hypothetical protein
VSPRQAEPASFSVEGNVNVHSPRPRARLPISQNAETYQTTRNTINGRDIAWRVASHWGQCTFILLRQPTCHRQIVKENVTYSLIRNLLIRLPDTTPLISSSVRSAASALARVQLSTAVAARLQATPVGGVETALHLAAVGRLAATWAVQMPASSTPIIQHPPTKGASNSTHHYTPGIDRIIMKPRVNML